MDVQTENMDPPPGESQPSGKIRKGFKLFGKRKPGSIFSIRNKGDGNKSPVIRSNTTDGLSENAAPDSEQDPDKGQETSQGETEQADEEPMSEDGVLAAAPARTSISSACSAKSLSFLSLLRGGRRGMGDRRVHTVSQPVGRQRRSLKGLFGSVKFRSKDKEDKEDVPPSPLLMSSRANSVEIIKEDLTLTPESQPRSLKSPVTESCEALKSLTTPDREAPTPTEDTTPQVTTGKVNCTEDEPVSELLLVPGDTSLSSLLADISSLLTFDSITGGGDIMADVEAEWGKASSAISAAVSEVPPSPTSLVSKPTVSSPLTSTSVSAAATAKPNPAAASTTASGRSFTPLTKPTLPSTPTAKLSTIIQTPTTSSTLTSNSHKINLGSSASSSYTENNSYSVNTSTKLSTSAVTLTSLSAPMMSSSSVIIKSTQSSTSATTTAPPTLPATIVKASITTPPLTSMAVKVASEIAAPPPTIDSVSNPNFVASLPVALAKPAVTHSPPSSVTTTKVDSGNSLNLQSCPPYKPSLHSTAGDFKAPLTGTATCTVTTKASCPPPVITSKVASVHTSAPTSSSESMITSKPTLPLSPVDQNKTSPLLVTAPDRCPPTNKTQPGPGSVSAQSSTSSDKIPATTKSTPAVVSLDKTPPASTLISAPTADTVLKGLTPPALSHSPKAATAPAQIPISVCKDPLATTQIPTAVCKDPPAPAQIPVSVSKDTPLSVKIPVSHPVPTHAPAPCLDTSPHSPPALWSRETPVSAVTRGSGQATVDGQLVISSSTPEGTMDGTTKTIHQYASKERKTSQVKASGLSKIPIVGGGRAGKIPVRDSHHVDNEASRDPPTPVSEEERHFNSHNAGRSKDNISDVEANVPTLKHTEEEDQQSSQTKVVSSLPRDSKIPVKHSTQASQIPQAREPIRTKIPVSKVPIRRAGQKPTVAGGGTQIRK